MNIKYSRERWDGFVEFFTPSNWQGHDAMLFKTDFFVCLFLCGTDINTVNMQICTMTFDAGHFHLIPWVRRGEICNEMSSASELFIRTTEQNYFISRAVLCLQAEPLKMQ